MTVGSGLLAIVVGQSALGVALVAATILASQLGTGWSNDWRDAARDTAVGRTDKPVASGAVARRTVGIGALVAGVVCVALSLVTAARAEPGPGLRWSAAGVVWLGLAGALAYNFGGKSTLFSPLPYLVSFACLAAFPVLALPQHVGVPVWLVAGAGLLGAGAHFLNVLPDLADDARTGVRGLPHRLGATGSWVAAAVLLLGATGLLVFGPPGRPGWPALGLFAVAVVVLPVGGYAARRPGSRAPFRAVLVIALADAALLLIAGPSIAP